MSGLAALTESFLQALTAGLLVGCIYGLMCLGLGLIFGVMRVINFAQGDFLMLGMYVTLYLAAALGGVGSVRARRLSFHRGDLRWPRAIRGRLLCCTACSYRA